MLDERFLENARALIAARSVSEEGNLPALDVLEPLCHEAGLETRRMPSPDTPDRDANLLAGPGGGEGATGAPLLLVTHADTVSPGPYDAWTSDPFTLRIDGKRAHGLGTADVKLDALCKLEALRRLKGRALARPVYFLATYGEEQGLRGAKAFAAHPPFIPRYVLCGEPSELCLHTSQKGYALVRLTLEPVTPRRVSRQKAHPLVFEGKAVHSSTPMLGVNAAEKAIAAFKLAASPAVLSINAGASTNSIPGRCTAEVVDAPVPGDAADISQALKATEKLLEDWKHRVASLHPMADLRFVPEFAVANITRIRSSGTEVEIALDARLLPTHDGDALVSGFLKGAQALCGEKVRLKSAVARAANGMSLSPESELVKIASKVLVSMGLDGTPRAKPTSTEASVFAQLGVEAAVFGPSPSSGNAHTVNEYALIDELEIAVDVYERFILALCGGEEGGGC